LRTGSYGVTLGKWRGEKLTVQEQLSPFMSAKHRSAKQACSILVLMQCSCVTSSCKPKGMCSVCYVPNCKVTTTPAAQLGAANCLLASFTSCTYTCHNSQMQFESVLHDELACRWLLSGVKPRQRPHRLRLQETRTSRKALARLSEASNKK